MLTPPSSCTSVIAARPTSPSLPRLSPRTLTLPTSLCSRVLSLARTSHLAYALLTHRALHYPNLKNSAHSLPADTCYGVPCHSTRALDAEHLLSMYGESAHTEATGVPSTPLQHLYRSEYLTTDEQDGLGAHHDANSPLLYEESGAFLLYGPTAPAPSSTTHSPPRASTTTSSTRASATSSTLSSVPSSTASSTLPSVPSSTLSFDQQHVLCYGAQSRSALITQHDDGVTQRARDSDPRTPHTEHDVSANDLSNPDRSYQLSLDDEDTVYYTQAQASTYGKDTDVPPCTPSTAAHARYSPSSPSHTTTSSHATTSSRSHPSSVCASTSAHLQSGAVGSRGRDWNDEFQRALDMKEDRAKYAKLSQLANDFLYCAKSYGKIIISEYHLSLDQKTIRPAGAGGIAGGQKYIVSNIFFKFALDVDLARVSESRSAGHPLGVRAKKPPFYMYGGRGVRNDSAAMKAAKNDLRGLLAYYGTRTSSLCYPLMTLIDYRGYRLVAVS
jgi:Clustered mitochondria